MYSAPSGAPIFELAQAHQGHSSSQYCTTSGMGVDLFIGSSAVSRGLRKRPGRCNANGGLGFSVM